jgi:CBS domain-containing protein
VEVREVMTRRVLTVQVDAPIDEAMRLMDAHDVRHLPVLRGQELLGVVSDRDLLSATGWLPDDARPPGAAKTVGELLRKKAITATPDDSVVMMAVDMVSREIGCLPVLEEGGLVGIVTEMDILRAYLDVSDQELDSRELHAPVAELMTTAPCSVEPSATLVEALGLQRAKHVRHLPVVEDHRLVGILSDRDLRRSVARDDPISTPVRELMSHDPLTLDPEEPSSRAARAMLEAGISSLPVEDDGRLVGILTLTDLLDHCIVNLRTPGA